MKEEEKEEKDKHPLQKLTEWLDTEEGQADLARFHEELREKDRILASRCARVEEYLKSHDFDALMDRILGEHQDDYRDKAWKKGYEPGPNNKFGLLLSYIENTYDPIHTTVDNDNPFISGEWFMKNYLFQLSIGQGSFWKVWKKVDGNYEHFMTI